MGRRLLAFAVLAFLGWAAPASAFTPPELFVRFTKESSEPASDWIPLAGAPTLDWLHQYEIGYRLQASGASNQLQSVALTVAGVPDGQPTQPRNTPPYGPYCVNRAGTVGDIQPVSPPLQFEGDGSYTFVVTVGPSTGDRSACLSGPSTTGTFRVDVHLAPTVVGAPMAVRTTPLSGNPFVGVRTDRTPPGGQGDIRCALDAIVQPDGSVTGTIVVPGPDETDVFSQISEKSFRRPGPWTCVARGASDGEDDSLSSARFFTPWSAPVQVAVHADFRRSLGRIAHSRSRRPQITFTAEFGGLAAGAKGTLRLYRFVRCRGRRTVLKKSSTYRATFDSKGRAKFTLRRPRRVGFYAGRLTFPGTRWLNAGDDPNAVPLLARSKDLVYAQSGETPHC
jgi:hypothetical protein